MSADNMPISVIHLMNHNTTSVSDLYNTTLVVSGGHDMNHTNRHVICTHKSTYLQRLSEQCYNRTIFFFVLVQETEWTGQHT